MSKVFAFAKSSKKNFSIPLDESEMRSLLRSDATQAGLKIARAQVKHVGRKKSYAVPLSTFVRKKRAHGMLSDVYKSGRYH